MLRKSSGYKNIPCFLLENKYTTLMLVMSGIDIDILLSKEVSIPNISIEMRYRKVSIPKMGIDRVKEGIDTFRYQIQVLILFYT